MGGWVNILIEYIIDPKNFFISFFLPTSTPPPPQGSHMLTDSGIPAGDVRLLAVLWAGDCICSVQIQTNNLPWWLNACEWAGQLHLKKFRQFCKFQDTKNYVQSNHNSQINKSINTYCLPLSNLKTLKIVSLLAVLLIFSLHKSCKINLKSTWLALYCATITHGLNKLLKACSSFCVF